MLSPRLLVGFALLGTAPVPCRTGDPVPVSESGPPPAEPPLSSDRPLRGDQLGTDKPAPADPSVAATPRGGFVGGVPNRKIEAVARDHFEKANFKEALDAHTRWEPRSFCGNCLYSMRDIRSRRIALCHSHLGDHVAAARVCLEAVGKQNLGDIGTAVFLIQLYREAGQLDDLAPLLDAIEGRVLVGKHPKPWLLPAEERGKLLGLIGTYSVRHHIRVAQLGELKPWPDAVPKPKPGVLPKSLPK